MNEEEQKMQTDIALIKADIKQINKFFTKVESSLEMMSDLSTTVAVQHEVVKNTVDKLEDLDNMVTEHRIEDQLRAERIMAQLEEYRKSARNDHQRLADHSAEKRIERHKEIMDEIRVMNDKMMVRIVKQDEKIQTLVNWRYYMMGIGAVLLFLLAKAVDITSFFG